MRKPRVSAKLRRQTGERLRRIARAAEVFIDGEAFKGVVIDPELNTGDDYRVDHDKFIAVKQTLFKLKRIEPGDVGLLTWRRFKDQADICVPLDAHPCSVRPGDHPVSEAMAAAFKGETAVQELEFHGCPLLSVCAPIRDSLDEVVGVVEVFASLAPERYKVDQIDY